MVVQALKVSTVEVEAKDKRLGILETSLGYKRPYFMGGGALYLHMNTTLPPGDCLGYLWYLIQYL